MRPAPAFETLELAYRIDLPKKIWLKRLAEDIHRRRELGDGVLAYELDISNPAASGKLGEVEATGGIEPFAQNTEPLHRMISANVYHKILRQGTHCSTISTSMRALGESIGDYPILADMIHRSGAEDIWAVCTVNPDARTLTFAIPLRHRYDPTPNEARFWRRIGAHIAAGHRLRRRLGPSEAESSADAVLHPDGRALELAGDAIADHEALCHTVRALDQAKARDFRSGNCESVDLWHGLLAGRWSLVDRVDTDGKHYVLAVRNDPEADAPRVLSRREAQVASYIAQGHSHKFVSYELGIAVSTVGTHLRNALGKLGLSSQTELAWIYGTLRAEHDRPAAASEDSFDRDDQGSV
jgi:DNA-binding CsgD family transcriptional regulator